MVGGRVTIMPSAKPALFSDSEDFVETVTTNAEANPQTKEWGKFMWAAETETESDDKVGEGFHRFPADGGGPVRQMGPMMDHFLFGADAQQDFQIPATHQDAAAMLWRARPSECPPGIIATATMNWKWNRMHQFFGYS